MSAPQSWLKKLQRGTFRLGITLKGIDGLLESAAGAVLLVNPGVLRNLSLTMSMWTYGHFHFHHTHKVVGGRVADQLAATDPIFASLYLLSHGFVKLVLAAALWMNRLWAYPVAIFVFAAFAVYQIFRLERVYSIALLLLTISDLVIILLTSLEYRDRRRAHLPSVQGAQRQEINP
jgi:uncharacterized membrane protein